MVSNIVYMQVTHLSTNTIPSVPVYPPIPTTQHHTHTHNTRTQSTQNSIIVHRQ